MTSNFNSSTNNLINNPKWVYKILDVIMLTKMKQRKIDLEILIAMFQGNKWFYDLFFLNLIWTAKSYNSRENTAEGRLNLAKENILSDALYGFHRVTDSQERLGFLINMHTVNL